MTLTVSIPNDVPKISQCVSFTEIKESAQVCQLAWEACELWRESVSRQCERAFTFVPALTNR